MAQRGKKKATRKEASRAGEKVKDPREAAIGPVEIYEHTRSRSSDWSTAEPVVGETEDLVDADPALETEDRPREFSARDNPFESREPVREMDPSASVASTDEALEEDFDPTPTHGMTQPPLGDEDTALTEALGMEGGIVHLVDREDMGKGVQNDPSAYAQGPGKPGLVEGATPAEDLRDTFLDPAARAGQARTSAEDVLRARGMAETRDWSASGAMVE
ncbi:MAG TPA: hypothetical protein VK465_06195, partial [Fibrobacteria bacterium]|nr:hypothetical protein [Fibrobacteria bacterium]